MVRGRLRPADRRDQTIAFIGRAHQSGELAVEARRVFVERRMADAVILPLYYLLNGKDNAAASVMGYEISRPTLFDARSGQFVGWVERSETHRFAAPP